MGRTENQIWGIAMRLQITKSRNAICFYAVKSVRKDGKNTNEVVEKLGNLETVRERAGSQDPYEWAKEYVKSLTDKEKDQSRTMLIPFSQSTLIPKDCKIRFNGGYLFLESLYNSLKLPEICKAITRKHKFGYDLNSILSRLVFCRIIHPSSKLGTYEFSQTLLEEPNFSLEDIYHSLDILAKSSDYIQSKLYSHSLSVCDRNTEVLYYDCTNYFFELEQESGLRQFGHGKEGRPLPIVEMGLFMDGNGIPLSFCIHSGNTSEQTTLRPLEKRILDDFKLSKFIVCTDAGLSSANNKYFNSREKRNFITATSAQRLPDERRERLLKADGWLLVNGDGKTKYNIDKISDSEEQSKLYENAVFYKEEWFLDTVEIYDELLDKKVKRDLEQRLIVTYSIKYRNYMREIRSHRIERARKLIDRGKDAVLRKGQNDVRQYIKAVSFTDDGVVADHQVYGIDEQAVAEAAKYDGFYAVYTSLDDKEYPISRIVTINRGRWEIEECFRILKTEFRARPVYLQLDQRIHAHFLTCYIALVILRILEQKTKKKYTYCQLIDCLSNMDFCKVKDSGYIPAYTRTSITDDLHDIFGFRTDYEILSNAALKKIIGKVKK